MSSKPLVIGDSIQARCTKCRKITGHIVITMSEEYPTEVQCSKCQHRHASTAKKPVVRRPVDPKKGEREEWAALRPGMDSARATDYSMTSAYKVKALVNHPVFGLGLVKRMAGQQKMSVLFADGEKIMRCQ